MPVEKIRNPGWRKRALRVRSWALTIGPALLLGGGFAVTLGLSYMGVFGEYKATIHPVERMIPMWVWSTAWVVAGAGMVLAALKPACRFANPAFTVWTVMMFIWGASWFVSWAQADIDRGVAFSFLYASFPLTIAWATWRGSRYEINIEGGAADGD